MRSAADSTVYIEVRHCDAECRRDKCEAQQAVYDGMRRKPPAMGSKSSRDPRDEDTDWEKEKSAECPAYGVSYLELVFREHYC